MKIYNICGGLNNNLKNSSIKLVKIFFNKSILIFEARLGTSNGSIGNGLSNLESTLNKNV